MILGLNAIREVKIRETNSASYNCFLCFSCHTSMDIVEHIVSLKHRKKYLVRYKEAIKKPFNNVNYQTPLLPFLIGQITRFLCVSLIENKKYL